MQIVLVTTTGPDPKQIKSSSSPNSRAADGQTTLSASGLVFDDLTGLVITSLAPLLPFLAADLRAHPAAAAGPVALLPGTRLTCAGPGFPDGVDASIECIVEVPGAAAALRSLLTAHSSTPWGVGWGPARGTSLGTQIVIGSHVAVLRLQNNLTTENEGEQSRRTVAVAPLTSLGAGSAVSAFGCPFGALVSLKFRSFVVNGIISTVIASKDPKLEPPIALADLRCLPGMEGGAVVASPIPAASTHVDGPGGRISESVTLIGLLGLPLRALEAHAETAVVLSATAALGAVRAALGISGARLSTLESIKDHKTLDELNNSNPSLDAALRAVVAVDVGSGWASGVLISAAGHVLTAAHALSPTTHPSPSPKLRVMVEGRWHPAAVVHAFAPPLDLAVLLIDRGSSSNLPSPVLFSPKIDIKKGERVLVAGFPLWRPHQSDRPLVTAGTAALVAPLPPLAPAAVVTTAAVHAGASGGAVLDPCGTLVGLVTSNTRLALTGGQRAFLPNPDDQSPGSQGPAMLFPHLNYCLGPAALAPAVGACVSGRAPDWAAVEADMRNDGVMDTWRSMRSMEGTQKERTRPGPPPALANMLRRLEGSVQSKL